MSGVVENDLAKKIRIAVTGGEGMLGRALGRALVGHSVHPLTSRDADVTSLPALRQVFSDLSPDWIIHTAAFTNVDRAETESFEAYRINALGTRNVAVAAAESKCGLIYYSTDYVFDGAGPNPYREWDPTNPLNEYGRSKLAGELFVRSLCPLHLVIRTSWLFGAGESHFVKKILDRCQTETELRVVNDQRGSPTFTTDLAYMTRYLVEGRKQGIYHVTNSGDCTWYELAREIVSLKKIQVNVIPVDSSSFSAPARRPAYSVLDNYLLKLERIPLLRPWQNALAGFLGG